MNKHCNVLGKLERLNRENFFDFASWEETQNWFMLYSQSCEELATFLRQKHSSLLWSNVHNFFLFVGQWFTMQGVNSQHINFFVTYAWAN